MRQYAHPFMYNELAYFKSLIDLQMCNIIVLETVKVVMHFAPEFLCSNDGHHFYLLAEKQCPRAAFKLSAHLR